MVYIYGTKLKIKKQETYLTPMNSLWRANYVKLVAEL